MYREKKTGYDAAADNVQNSTDEKNASKGNFQNVDQKNEISGGTPSWDIEDDKMNVIKDVLSMKTMTVGDTFQPLNDAFAIERNDVLNKEKVKQIYHSGFSIIPVYEESKENICGIILARELIQNTLSDEKITALCIQKTPICVSSERNLIDLLNVFRLGRSKDIVRMAVVCCNRWKILNGKGGEKISMYHDQQSAFEATTGTRGYKKQRKNRGCQEPK